MIATRTCTYCHAVTYTPQCLTVVCATHLHNKTASHIYPETHYVCHDASRLTDRLVYYTSPASDHTHKYTHTYTPLPVCPSCALPTGRMYPPPPPPWLPSPLGPLWVPSSRGCTAHKLLLFIFTLNSFMAYALLPHSQ